MTTKFHLSLLLAVVAVVSLHVRTTDGCSPIVPQPPQTLEYKMVMSDVVVQGYTRHRHRDTSYPHDDVYIVDFEIRCIFKGSPLPEMIRIYGVGTIGGHCLSTEMPENKSLLLYLRRGSDGNYEPVYHEDPGEAQYLEEIIGLCETRIAYPEGYSENRNKETCPEPYQYDDCVPIPTMPTSATTELNEPTLVPNMDETGTGKSGHNTGSTDNDNANNMNKEGDHSMNNKEGDHSMNKDAKGKGGDNATGGEAAYDSVKTNGGDSDGGAVNTGDSSGKTGITEEEEDNDPDGSMATVTFNLLIPLAMLAVWLALV